MLMRLTWPRHNRNSVVATDISSPDDLTNWRPKWHELPQHASMNKPSATKNMRPNVPTHRNTPLLETIITPEPTITTSIQHHDVWCWLHKLKIPLYLHNSSHLIIIYIQGVLQYNTSLVFRLCSGFPTSQPYSHNVIITHISLHDTGTITRRSQKIIVRYFTYESTNERRTKEKWSAKQMTLTQILYANPRG